MRAAIRRRELEIIQSHGYGREPFVVADADGRGGTCAPSDARETIGAAIERIAAHFLERECELLPDVEPTLVELAARHHLTLFTKGQPREQMRKLERSGLRRHFSHVEVPPEKDEAAYRRLVEAAALDRDARFHDRQQSPLGYQPGVARGPARGFHPASAYLGAGARRGRPGRRTCHRDYQLSHPA